MQCFRKFLVAKKLMDKKGGVSKLCIENFLSHSAKKLRRGTLLSFINFGFRQNFCFKGLRHVFLSKFSCLTVPKQFVEEHFCAVFKKICGSEKV